MFGGWISPAKAQSKGERMVVCGMMMMMMVSSDGFVVDVTPGQNRGAQCATKRNANQRRRCRAHQRQLTSLAANLPLSISLGLITRRGNGTTRYGVPSCRPPFVYNALHTHSHRRLGVTTGERWRESWGTGNDERRREQHTRQRLLSEEKAGAPTYNASAQ